MSAATRVRRPLPRMSRSKWGTGQAATDGYRFEYRGLNFETYRPVGFTAPDGATVVYGWSVFWEIDAETREEITGGWGERAPAVRAALDEIDERAKRNAAHEEEHPGMAPDPGRCCGHLDGRHARGRYGPVRCTVRGCGCVMYRRGPLVDLRPDDVPRGAVLALYSTLRGGAFELPVSAVGVRRVDGGGRVVHVCDTSGTMRADLDPEVSVYALAHTVPPGTPTAAGRWEEETGGRIPCEARPFFFGSGDCERAAPVAYVVDHPAPEAGGPEELRVCAACVRSYMDQSPADYADESAGETVADVEPGQFFDSVTADGKRSPAGGFDARGNACADG